ncbi:MAG TPA: Sec-independent protein translocase protein TatB [Steroidobacteraceae bacterium]|jgi:sec-independent protein translocase protein TatB|nr:Sec-independent protein translocase protein TatB [Steroidobacteraceae bacterium]
MFEGRFPELVIIFVVALVVLGPHKLPQVAALVGRWLGHARAMARQFRDQLEEEAQNMQRPVVDPTRPAPPPPATPVAPQPPAATESATPDSASHERGA